MSPEHTYLDKDGNTASLSPGPTMDIALIRELFRHCIEAEKILGTGQRISVIVLPLRCPKLPPYRINSTRLSPGVDRGLDARFRRATTSPPIFPFFPGSTITLRGNPDLAGAINKWMETRRPRGGWITAWDTGVWARLERGDKVEQWLDTLMKNSLADNLHNRGNNQSDANFGLTAAIAESLLQSHAGEISLVARPAAKLVQRICPGVARPRRF